MVVPYNANDVLVVPAVGKTNAPDEKALSENKEIDSSKVKDVADAAKNK